MSTSENSFSLGLLRFCPYTRMWCFAQFITICTIKKNVKNTHGRVLLLVKLQVSACNFMKCNTPEWVFFTFFKLYRWYQIVQRVTYGSAKTQIFAYFRLCISGHRLCEFQFWFRREVSFWYQAVDNLLFKIQDNTSAITFST